MAQNQPTRGSPRLLQRFADEKAAEMAQLVECAALFVLLIALMVSVCFQYPLVQFGLNGNPDVSSTCVGRRLCSEPGRARQRWRARGTAGGGRVWEEAALTSTTAAAWAAGSCGPAGSTEPPKKCNTLK